MGFTVIRRPGELSGRLIPTDRPAPDGSYVFVLGSSDRGRTGYFKEGIPAVVFQTFTNAPTVNNVIRARVRLVGPSNASPVGWSWEFRSIIDILSSTALVQRTLAVDVETIHDDFAMLLRGFVPPVNAAFFLAVVPPGPPPLDIVEMTIPSVFVDSVIDVTETVPFIANRYPPANQTRVLTTSSVEFDYMVPDVGDFASAKVYVNGALAYDTGAGGIQAGWSGSVAAFYTGVTKFILTPDVPFASLQVVTVEVEASDDTAPIAREIEASWSFTIQDLTAPRLIVASAQDSKTIRVAFDESVILGETTTWTLERLLAPSVMAEVVEVLQVTSTTYDLKTSIPLTFGASYRLRVANVEDEFGNALVAPYDVVPFVAFDPLKPARRRFELWWMLPRMNRDEDATFDLFKMVAIFQEIVDQILIDVDRWTEILDVDTAADRYLDQMLISLGNPFAFDLVEIDKRRLIRVLVDMYRLKGTAPGIINTIRFFVGVEVTITAYNDEGWILGEDELGIDTILGPSTSFALYAFDVISPIALTDEQRRQIRAIVEYLKPAHTHFIQLIEPTIPTVIDHVELGLSELGVEFELH